jgi:hypothetical protein
MEEFHLGAEQHHAFDLVKDYLSSVSVLKAPKSGFPFKLYIVAEDKVYWGPSSSEGPKNVTDHMFSVYRLLQGVLASA